VCSMVWGWLFFGGSHPSMEILCGLNCPENQIGGHHTPEIDKRG